VEQLDLSFAGKVDSSAGSRAASWGGVKAHRVFRGDEVHPPLSLTMVRARFAERGVVRPFRLGCRKRIDEIDDGIFGPVAVEIVSAGAQQNASQYRQNELQLHSLRRQPTSRPVAGATLIQTPMSGIGFSALPSEQMLDPIRPTAIAGL
jgi:hypothetical protein